MQAGRLIVTAVVAAFLATTAGAHAATYYYSGNVEICPQNVIPCITGSLSVGDDVVGTIDVVDSVIQPDSSFEYLAITDYVFSAGAFTLETDNTDLVSGSFQTDSLGELVGGFLHVFAPVDALSPGSPATTLTLDLTTSSWFLLGQTYPNPEWPFVAALGTGSFSSVIPVPGAMSVFAPALGLLILMRRRLNQS